jgi:4-hydroxybenzoate polyprenyltransferase
MALNIAWVGIGLLYLTPVLQGIETTIGGVPFFAIWATIVGPLLMVALYGINSYARIKADKTTEQRETAAGGGTAGGE